MRVHTLLMMVCLLLVGFQLQAADPPSKPPELSSIAPGAELWRDVRQRDQDVTGTTQVRSPGADVLINVSGQAWREYRMQELIPLSGAAILGGAAASAEDPGGDLAGRVSLCAGAPICPAPGRGGAGCAGRRAAEAKESGRRAGEEGRDVSG